MLVGNDIIGLKDIIINIVNKIIYVDSYKTIIKVLARLRDEFIRRKVYIKSTTLVSSYSDVILSIKSINLSENCDFLFKSIT